VNAFYTYGINNTTKSEIGTILTAGDVTCVGIELDTNAGDRTTGHINVIGCDTDWTPRGNQAIFDGGGDATNCMLFKGKERWNFGYITFQNAFDDGVTTDGQACDWPIFRHCKFVSNGALGIDMNGDMVALKLIRCVMASNDGAGANLNKTPGTAAFCKFRDNAGRGVDYATWWTFFACLFYENEADNLEIRSRNNIINCVFDGALNGSDGITQAGDTDSGNIILASRITNNTGYGFSMFSAVDDSNIEDWNVFYGNTSGDLENSLSGKHSYGDGAEHLSDPSDDGYVDSSNSDFNVATGKELRSVAIDLDWDL